MFTLQVPGWFPGVGIAGARVGRVHKRGLPLAIASLVIALTAAAAAADDTSRGSPNGPAVPAERGTVSNEIVEIRALLAEPTQLATWLADRDPVVAAARARQDAATEQREQTTVLPNPQLSVSVGGFVLGSTNPQRLGLGETTNVTGGLNELVELGKRGPRQLAARLRADAAGRLGAASLGTRIGDATLALGKLAYVNARRIVVAANLQAAQTLEALEKVRRDHADLSGAEFSRIELETQQLALQLGRADADVAAAIAQCGSVLIARCSPDETFDASALDAGAPIPLPLPSGAAVDTAINHRPAREAARLEAAALGADATLASRRAIPDLTLGVGYTLDNLTIAGNQHQTLLFSVGIPLPFFDRGNHDAAAARANARAIIAEQRAATHEAHGQVEALFAQRATLETTLAKLEAEALPMSTHIVQQTRRSFDLGQAGLAELLLAERARRELVLEVLDTRFDLFNTRAQLRQVLGLDDQAARAVGARR